MAGYGDEMRSDINLYARNSKRIYKVKSEDLEVKCVAQKEQKWSVKAKDCDFYKMDAVGAVEKTVSLFTDIEDIQDVAAAQKVEYDG